MCFIDFEEPFDTLRHETIMERLRRLGIVEADLRVLANLLWGQKTFVGIGEDINVLTGCDG